MSKADERLREALRVARAIRRVAAAAADDRELVAEKVRRWQRLRVPALPEWAQEVSSHDPAWAERFRLEAERLRAAFPEGEIADLQHIGSSAVPHLPSKPVLDLLVAVRSGPGSPEQVATFATLGYQHFGASPCDREAEWYWRASGEGGYLVAHVCSEENPWRQTAVDFRDYMIARPEECERYERIKRELRAEGASLLEYSLGKLGLFYEISARAAAWRASGGC